MSLLDTISSQLGSVPGAANPSSGSIESRLVRGVMAVITDRSNGGLQGLIQSFEQHGLGSIIHSWTGTGAKQPVSPQQLAEGLGQDRVQKIAQASGLPADDALNRLAPMMPGLIDQITPPGRIPGLLELVGALAKLGA